MDDKILNFQEYKNKKENEELYSKVDKMIAHLIDRKQTTEEKQNEKPSTR